MTRPKSTLLVPMRPMVRITQSPYEATDGGTNIRSAEADEPVFDEMKKLLDPLEIGRKKEASLAAVKKFGMDVAKQLVEASDGIQRSGMVYSYEWSTGMIHEKRVGQIDKHLLILLLLEQRMAQNNDSLSLIVKDLELIRTFLGALAGWKLTKKYPQLTQCKGVSSFPTNRSNCLKCIIFIVRAWQCCRWLRKPKLDHSLQNKISDCLNILDANVKTHVSPVRRNPATTSAAGARAMPRAQPHQQLQQSNTSQGISHQLFASSSTEGKVFPTEAAAPARQVTNEQLQQSFLENPARQLWVDDEQSGGSLLSDHERKNYWHPSDDGEMILNPTELEMAWLLEESLYCTRKKDVNWVFIFKMASPALKMELRTKLPPPGTDGDHNGDEKKRLGKMVRMDFGVVAKRFQEVRRDIRKRLILRETRPAMKKIVPHFRRLTNPVFAQRLREAKA